MLQTSDNQDLYLTAYEEFERTVADSDPDWLHQIRKQAFARFRDLGFPGRRNEDWKYTNLTRLLDVPFKLALSDDSDDSFDDLKNYLFDDAVQVVFHNGRYCESLSNAAELPAGLTVCNLKAAIRLHEDVVSRHLGRYADYDELALTALNTAYLEDGGFVLVRDGAVVEKPIHIVHYSTAPVEPVMSFPRNLVIAGKGSQATVVESYIGPADQVYFTNAVTEIGADKNSIIDHYKVLRDSNSAFHIANLQVKQERGSNVSSHYFALSGGLARNETRTLFNGEHGECTLNGLYLGSGKQHIDSLSVIDHAKPHCHSYELYKGLLDDNAKGVFNGKIYVRPDAQKTDAKQSNQCILLSDTATIDTKPQLEIFADDVKCTHGATVGQLDENGLFYLRSRGIPLAQARSLMIYAFANDIIQRIKVDAVRSQLEEVLLTRQQLPKFQERQ